MPAMATAISTTVPRVAAGLLLTLLVTPASAARISSHGMFDPNFGDESQDASEVVNKFCNISRLRLEDLEEGVAGASDDTVLGDLKKDIANSIRGEIGKNMDEATRELSTFYLCVRWVPDASYGDLAAAEQTAGTFAVDTPEKGPTSVAEAYQKFKFVPIRCSKNLAVWDKKSDGPDGTYFEQFEKDTTEVADWLDERAHGAVAKSLANVDRAFCRKEVSNLTGTEQGMGSIACEFSAQWWARLVMGGGTREERWKDMAGNSTVLDPKEEGVEGHVLKVITKSVSGYVSDASAPRGGQNYILSIEHGSHKARLETKDPLGKLLSLTVPGNGHVTVRLSEPEASGWIFRGKEKVLAEKTMKLEDFKAALSKEGSEMSVELFDLPGHEQAKDKKGMLGMKTMVVLKVEECGDPAAEWNKDIRAFTQFFPYSSFIASNSPGVDTPAPEERMMLCFGKRVASDLHRRPTGGHILADMNNLGCHGFWSMTEASDLLKKMVQMWRPPTCQLSDLSFRMKTEMAALAAEMNNRFFEALPSMILSDVLGTDTPHHKKAIEIDGQTYIDGMRVGKRADPSQKGIVVVKDGKLCVAWTSDPTNILPVKASDIVILVGEDDKTWFETITQGVAKQMASIRDVVQSISDIAFERLGQIDSKRSKLTALVSTSTAKWSVCPIDSSATTEDLDASLGNSDVNFRDFLKDAHSRTGSKPGETLPGQACEPADSLPGLGQCQICSISGMYSDFLEKYKDEQFVCPNTPMLDAAEQLEILRDHDQCLVHMSDRQMAVAEWHYNGRHPLARQYDKKENPATDKMRLMKLLKVSPEDGKAQVEMGLSCTMQEMEEAPRFCKLAPVSNLSPDLETLASWLADVLSETSVSGLGVVSSLVSSKAGGLYNFTFREQSSLAHLEHAVAIVEGAWRTAKSGAAAAWGFGKWLMEDPVGKERQKHLEERLLTSSPAAELLHSASFQKRMPDGDSKTDRSASQEAYLRYVVTCPCDKFDPVSELAMRTVWGETALRLLRHLNKQKPSMVTEPTFSMQLRGIAALHRKEQSFTEKRQSIWLERKVMMAVAHRSSDTGQPQPASDWWVMTDQGLLHLVGGAGASNHLDISDGIETEEGKSEVRGELAKLRGMEATVWCGKKKDFPKDVGAPPASEQPLRDCIRQGVKDNEDLLRKNPVDHYLAEEVVVVVKFGEITERRCQTTEGATSEAADAVCSLDAKKEEGPHDALLGLFEGADKASLQGAQAGAGYPANTLTEVFLRPEDVAKELNL